MAAMAWQQHMSQREGSGWKKEEGGQNIPATTYKPSLSLLLCLVPRKVPLCLVEGSERAAWQQHENAHHPSHLPPPTDSLWSPSRAACDILLPRLPHCIGWIGLGRLPGFLLRAFSLHTLPPAYLLLPRTYLLHVVVYIYIYTFCLRISFPYAFSHAYCLLLYTKTPARAWRARVKMSYV